MISLFLLLLIGFGEVWGATPAEFATGYVTVTDFDASTTFSGNGNSGTGLNQVTNHVFSATQGHAKFSINNVDKYDGSRLCFGDQAKNTTKEVTFSWLGVSDEYSVSVSRIDAKIRAYSAVKYNSSAWFYGHDAQGYSTNSTGTKGAGDIAATSNLDGSSIILYLKNTETGGISDRTLQYTLHDIKFTYVVTHKEYLFGFDAVVGGTVGGSYGTATASGKDTVQASVGETNASKTVTYTATPNTGCQFLGWFENSSCTGAPVSTNATYTTTLENSTAGTFTTRTLYAKFTNKFDKEITWGQDFGTPIRSNVIDLTASVPEGEIVTYTASPAERVSIDGSRITCLTAGSVTITAHSGETASYFAAEDVEKSFTIIEHTITTLPTASGTLAYEQTLNTISPIGGEANVAGSWAWKYPTSVPGAGTADQVAVFTPSSSVISTYPLECYVSVMVNKANPDVTCTVNDKTHYVDDEKIDLQTKWTREGDGAITYSVLSFEESGSNNEAGTNPYVENNRYLHLQKAGEVQVVMSILEGTNYIARNETINVEIKKYTPKFTWNSGTPYYYKSNIENIFSSTNEDFAATAVSSNPNVAEMEGYTLHIHNVNESNCEITMTQEENYKWNGQTGTYAVVPVDNTNRLPFTTWSEAELNKFTYEKVADGNIVWTSNYLKLEGDGDAAEKHIILHFEGIPDELTYDFGLQYRAGGGNGTYWYVAEGPSLDAMDTIHFQEWGSTKWYSEKYGNKRIKLSPTTRYVSLSYTGTSGACFQNISITALADKFEADVDDNTFDFGTKGAHYGHQEALITFNHVNAGRVTTAEIIGADAGKFTVSPTTIPGTGRDLYGSTTLLVSFDNNDDGRESDPYTATLRISDNNSHTEEVTLTGRRWGKTDPEITWNPNHMPYYVNSTINYLAVSTNTDYENCPLSYSTSNSSVAEVENGVLHIYDTKSEVTITIHQGANANYNAKDVEVRFTPIDKPDLIAPIQLTKAIYESGSFTPATDQLAWDSESSNDIRIGNNKGPGGYGSKSFMIAFGGVPDSLSFRYKTSTTMSTQSLSMNAPKWYVYESPDGSADSWHQVWYKADNRDEWKTIRLALRHDTKYIRFVYDGNYYGYYGNINITALDGIKYMRTSDGKYMSRGGNWSTQAVIDEIGVPVRVTRYTRDNDHSHDTTLVQFMDSKQYLFEDGDNLFTDNGDRTPIKWIQTVEGGRVSVRSANGSNKYITIADGVLKMTANAEDATQWEVEDYTIHRANVLAKLDAKAASAALRDFGSEMNTLANVRNQLTVNDYESVEIDIPHLNDDAYEAALEPRTDAGLPTVYSNTVSVTPGFYRLTVKAFYQTAPDPVDWDNNTNGMESVVAYVYANEAYYPMRSRYDVSGRNGAVIEAGTSINKGGYYYANDATAAHKVFENENAYINDVYVYVEDEGEGTGTLNYGIMNPSYVPGEKLIYENFRLTRFGRKEYVFSSEGEWGVTGNWEYNGETAPALPTINHAVIINQNVNITDTVKAYSVTIEDGKKVTILPGGGLKVGAGGIRNATKDNFKLQAATTGSDKGKTGYLRISPDYEGEMPEVTVEMFSIGYYNKSSNEENIAAWQFVGCPIDFEEKLAKTVFTRSWIYSYEESTDTWVNNRSTLVMQPFTGYKTTQYANSEGMLLTFEGKLVPLNRIDIIDLDYTDGHGYNLVANSYAAPIDITQFRDTDFVNAEKTIYIYNTGSRSQYLEKGAEGNSAGQYTAITIGTVEEMNTYFGGNPSVSPTIAPMQGFFVKATGADAKLKFDYNKLVWNADYKSHPNKPLRTPSRTTSNTGISAAMKITMEADGMSDEVYMLESERYESGYEDGYDAHKLESGAFNIFTVRDGDQLSIDATPDFAGTQIGVRTGNETAYTLHFTNIYGERSWSLMDIETGLTIDINEGTQYTFFAEPNATNTMRFYLIEREDNYSPAITTGVDNTDDNAKVHKFIKDNQMYILKNGKLYNAMGTVVR